LPFELLQKGSGHVQTFEKKKKQNSNFFDETRRIGMSMG